MNQQSKYLASGSIRYNSFEQKRLPMAAFSIQFTFNSQAH